MKTKEKRFSENTYILSLFFSFVYLINLYLLNSIVWILVGFSTILSFVVFIFDDIKLGKISRLIDISYKPQIYILVFLVYLFSSITGLTIILTKIPHLQINYIVIPIVITGVIFLGTIVGMFQKLIDSIKSS